MSINFRHRLHDPLHQQYFGNAVDMITASLPNNELQRGDTSLSTAAYCIRRATNNWSESEWAAWLSAAARLGNNEALCPSPAGLLTEQNLGFTDASKIETHFRDWGPELGRIERTRYMMSASGLAGYATLLTVHPRLHDGGLEVATVLTPGLKDALIADPIFSSFAKLACMY
jgi:trichothecene 3-O-acetyltransferase